MLWCPTFFPPLLSFSLSSKWLLLFIWTGPVSFSLSFSEGCGRIVKNRTLPNGERERETPCVTELSTRMVDGVQTAANRVLRNAPRIDRRAHKFSLTYHSLSIFSKALGRNRTCYLPAATPSKMSNQNQTAVIVRK